MVFWNRIYLYCNGIWYFWNVLGPKRFYVEKLGNDIFTPIGAHTLEKFDAKVEKIAIFTPLPDFFPHHLLIWFVEDNFSQMSWSVRKKLNWAADKVYGDQKFGFHLVFRAKNMNFFVLFLFEFSLFQNPFLTLKINLAPQKNPN